MSSKFSRARVLRKTPPQCKKKALPPPGTTPVVALPIITGAPLCGSIFWKSDSVFDPYHVTNQFTMQPTSPTTWSMPAYDHNSVQIAIDFFYSHTLGEYFITGSLRVNGILRSEILQPVRPYLAGQPFYVPAQRIEVSGGTPAEPTMAVAGFCF